MFTRKRLTPIRYPFHGLLLLAFVVHLSGCEEFDQLGVQEADYAPVQFSGVSAAEESSDGSLRLKWGIASGGDGKKVYRVYTLAIDTDPTESYKESSRVASYTSDLRTGYIAEEPDFAETPVESGTVVYESQDGSDAFEIDVTSLDHKKAYIFQVQAQDMTSGIRDANKVFFILSKSIIGGFNGCKSAVATSHTTAKVQVDFLKEFERVTIIRNGIPIHVIGDENSSVFIDSGLQPLSTYVYTCEAIFGDTQVLGDKEVEIVMPDAASFYSDYAGCSEGTPISSSRIQVQFEWPDNASKVSVYRDGIIRYSTSSKSSTSFTDTGLGEGETYTYTCEAEIEGEGVMGKDPLEVRTQITNPPTFAGVNAVAAASSSQITVSWAYPTGGPAPTVYKIYKSLGSTLDWGASPVAEVAAGSLSKTISSLGDEIPYIFGVRACSSDTICDSNTATETITLANSGAPQTSGASSIAIVDGDVVLTAPWSDADGAVAIRRVYQKTGASSTNIADYTVVKTEVVSDVTNPTTSLTITGILESTSYNFIVRDEDPSGNIESNTNVESVTTGDLTAPSFTGITGLVNGGSGAEEDTLIATFVGIDVEPGVSGGTTSYLVYTKSGGGDACDSGTLHATLAASSYASGSSHNYSITGLTSRTDYSVCIKAQDAAGNISNTTTFLSKSTLDITVPTFFGVQTFEYDGASGSFSATWTASPSSDALEYKIQLWKNTASPSAGAITTITRSHASFSTGFSFTSSDYTFADNDTVYVLVDACDDAATISGGSQNCTAADQATAKSKTVPDVTPPSGFSGVKGPADIGTPAEGQLQVAWFAPASWSDFRGFKVYDVDQGDNSLTQIGICPCAANHCPSNPTTCLVTGLDARRTYNLHVRAYDEAGNETSYLDPASNQSAKATIDTTSPTFSSNLSATLNTGTGDIDLTWNSAIDNQYATETGAVINYHIYRKSVTTFSNASDPSAEVAELGNQTTTGYSDSSIADGVTYFYTICVTDASSNESCDGNVKSVYISDITAPTATSLAATDVKIQPWTLSWNLSDNESSVGNIIVKIHKKVGSNPGDWPVTTGGELLQTANGTTSLNAQTGAIDAYVNYVIQATDEATNTTARGVSISSRALSVAEDSDIGLDASFSDGSNTPSYSLDGAASSCDDGSWSPALSVNSSTGVVSGTPTNDDVGSCDIYLTITSGDNIALQYYDVTVTNTNDVPTWDSTIADTSLIEGDGFSSVNASATDVDAGETPAYSFDTGAMTCDGLPWSPSLAINSSTGAISGAPTSVSAVETCTVVVQATSGIDTLSQTFTVTRYPPVPGAFSCDSGSIYTSCNVSSSITLADGDILPIPGNLIVNSGGDINTAALDVISMYVGGDVTVESGGTIHANVWPLDATNVTVDSGGSISAVELGYAGGSYNTSTAALGSGKGSNNNYGGSGGTHYGKGGKAAFVTTSVATYGNSADPTTFGSGGGGGNTNNGGTGSGKIKLLASGTLTVDGELTVAGGGAPCPSSGNRGGAGGGGGTLVVTTDRFEGAGTVTARGGDGSVDCVRGGGGGGGYLIFTTTSIDFSGEINARGGYRGGNAGGAGIDTEGRMGGDGFFTFSVSEFCDAGDLATTCTISGNKILTDGETISGNNLVVASGAQIRSLGKASAATINMSGDITVQSGGALNANLTELSAQNLTVIGEINLDSRGYGGGIFGTGYGPGAASHAKSGGDGGGHGGIGGIGHDGGYYTHSGSGATKGQVNGSATAPVDFGSGGGSPAYGGFTLGMQGGDGGGKIKINISGELNLTGNITARGGDGIANGSAYASSGGAGGSIWIIADTFVGTGILDASGGDSSPDTSYDAGGGGGGRISIDTTTSNTFSGSITYTGGTGHHENGGDGSLCENGAGGDCS